MGISVVCLFIWHSSSSKPPGVILHPNNCIQTEDNMLVAGVQAKERTPVWPKKGCEQTALYQTWESCYEMLSKPIPWQWTFTERRDSIWQFASHIARAFRGSWPGGIRCDGGRGRGWYGVIPEGLRKLSMSELRCGSPLTRLFDNKEGWLAYMSRFKSNCRKRAWLG